MDADLAFGRVLRNMRQDAGLTQEQIGLEADLRRTYVSILELGQQQPSLTTIIKLAQALNCSPGNLIDKVVNELETEN